MSDEERDAGADDGRGAPPPMSHEPEIGWGDDVSAASDPALTSRLEAIHRSMSLLEGRLAGIEDRLAVVAGTDTAAALTGRFDTLHAALEELDRGLRADLDALLETSASDSGAVTGVLEQLKETLQDLASGEVVGALWDEVRQVRATVEALVDRDAAGPDPEAVASLRDDVTGLTASVRELLDQAEVVDDHEVGASDTGRLISLAADLAALRDELSQGLVVDPSAEVETELRAMRTGIEDIIGRLDEGLVLAEDAATAPAAPTSDLADLVADQIATLRDQISVEFERVRQLVDGGGETLDLAPLTARLDRLHDDLADAGAEPAGEAPAVDMAPLLDALHDVQDGIATLLERPVSTAQPSGPAPAPADTYATVDPDVIDLLREEIRATGTANDELVETLGAELKALRRRIRLRAEGELFSDDQLDRIAEAVARKLGE